MEELKPLEDILNPDFRATCRGFSLEVLYKLAARHDLSSAAPESVRHQFEIARHAYVYSWLYTPLCAAAELFSMLAVEDALRIRHKATPRSKAYSNDPGLKKLLEIAIAEGWIKDEGFDFGASFAEDSMPAQAPERRRPTEIVLNLLPEFRNHKAHGNSSMALENVDIHLQRSREIINQLFPERG